ncbi:abortive infection family protein [bacterium]|nr:abortive infection family protein [bacterium]
MDSNQEISEKIETFRNLLISYSTGGQVEDGEYRRLRSDLFRDVSLRGELPRFVRTCSDLKQFWSFIKQKSSTYQGRREFLWRKFRPLLDEFERISHAPSDKGVAETLTLLNSDLIHESWRTALERRLDDPDGAITAARTILESVCKHILDKMEIEYPEHSDLPKLYKLTAQSLSVAPSQQTEPVFRQVLGGCTAVVEGIGAIRNALGDAHGKGSSFVKPDLRHAELAVNLAGATAIFLLQTWDEKDKNTI